MVQYYNSGAGNVKTGRTLELPASWPCLIREPQVPDRDPVPIQTNGQLLRNGTYSQPLASRVVVCVCLCALTRLESRRIYCELHHEKESDYLKTTITKTCWEEKAPMPIKFIE